MNEKPLHPVKSAGNGAEPWRVVLVAEALHRSPPYAYTVGLGAAFGHPEVAIFGLNGDVHFMHRVLRAIGDRVALGEHFSHGDRKRNILPGYVCPIVRLPGSAHAAHLEEAVAAGDKKSLRAVQCVWPDPHRRLPWDPRVMLPVLARQPVFQRPDAGECDAPWPFAEPHSRLVFTTRQVVSGKEPFRFVGRFHEGGWQLTCGSTDNPADLVMTTLGWALDRDATLAQLGKLRPGRCAERDGDDMPWRRGKMPDD